MGKAQLSFKTNKTCLALMAADKSQKMWPEHGGKAQKSASKKTKPKFVILFFKILQF